jgi:hypothetical protein
MKRVARGGGKRRQEMNAASRNAQQETHVAAYKTEINHETTD